MIRDDKLVPEQVLLLIEDANLVDVVLGESVHGVAYDGTPDCGVCWLLNRPGVLILL